MLSFDTNACSMQHYNPTKPQQPLAPLVCLQLFTPTGETATAPRKCHQSATHINWDYAV